jgi:hypothetical protein
MRFFVRRVKQLVFKQARRSGMIERRARPENALLPLDFFISDAVIIRRAAFAGHAQFVPNLPDIRVLKLFFASQSFAQITENLPVAARLARRINRLFNANHAALGAGDGSFVFLVQRTGQNDVGVARGFAHEKFDDGKMLQLRQHFLGEIRVRQTHDGIDANRQ